MANVSFKGNIGKVRGLTFTQTNKPMFSFSVGESHRKFNQQTSEWEDIGTTWWNVTVFDRLAEALADIIQEGAKQQVNVSGRSQTRFYQTNDGGEGSSLDVVADTVGIVPKPPQQSQNAPQYAPPGQPPQQPPQQPQQPAGNPWGGTQVPFGQESYPPPF